jgi:deoxycytidylate deaminase
MKTKWIQRFLGMAEYVSTWSKDPSTKTGAVIVAPDNMIISLGYNGFPKGVHDDPALYKNRSAKYERIIHSEVNAILAARTDLSGCSIFCYPLMPCSRCATVIIQSGISTVCFPYSEDTAVLDRFRVSHEHAIEMFQDAGVELICYDE